LTDAEYVLHSEAVGGRVLPNQINWPGNNTALACMNQCAAFGYPVSGTEVGQILSRKIDVLTCLGYSTANNAVSENGY
jgi:hypothetical protein